MSTLIRPELSETNRYWMDKPFDDPITVIENFMFEMAMYACYGEDEQRSFIFQNAVETAEELSLLFV